MRTRHRLRTTAAVLAAVGGLGLAGCGTGDTTEPTPTPGQTTSGTSGPLALARSLAPDETATTAPSPPAADPGPKTATPPDVAGTPRLTVTDLRVGEHQGQDRVVFEFGGTGTPGYSVDYVDAPTQQGSGNPLELDGDSFLQVTIDGQALPSESGLTEIPVGTVGADEVSGVAGVAYAGQFEGRAQAVIGLEGTDRPFTVFTLENPTRLVVDVQRQTPHS